MSDHSEYSRHLDEQSRAHFEYVQAAEYAEWEQMNRVMVAVRSQYPRVYRALQSEADPFAPLRAILAVAAIEPNDDEKTRRGFHVRVGEWLRASIIGHGLHARYREAVTLLDEAVSLLPLSREDDEEPSEADLIRYYNHEGGEDPVTRQQIRDAGRPGL